MEEITALPQTAADALDAWDNGHMLRAFRVNTDGATQNEIYGAAFDMIRAGHVAVSSRELSEHDKLTRREHEAAHSIAYVATRAGWAVMVQGHIHENSPEITIQKS
jgi:hypothetical protein